eukprot:COSAG02_NODE_2262_length_9317_cov_21.181927_16_plen_82_part_00
MRIALKLSSESQVFRQSIRFVSELVRIPYIDTQSNSCMTSQQNATPTGSPITDAAIDSVQTGTRGSSHPAVRIKSEKSRLQ